MPQSTEYESNILICVQKFASNNKSFSISRLAVTVFSIFSSLLCRGVHFSYFC